MKWIVYNVACNEDKTVLIKKKIAIDNNNKLEAIEIAESESHDGTWATETDDVAFDDKKERYVSHPIILKENVDYGTKLPTVGEVGQVFFKKVT